MAPYSIQKLFTKSTQGFPHSSLGGSRFTNNLAQTLKESKEIIKFHQTWAPYEWINPHKAWAIIKSKLFTHNLSKPQAAKCSWSRWPLCGIVHCGHVRRAAAWINSANITSSTSIPTNWHIAGRIEEFIVLHSWGQTPTSLRPRWDLGRGQGPRVVKVTGGCLWRAALEYHISKLGIIIKVLAQYWCIYLELRKTRKCIQMALLATCIVFILPLINQL